MTGPAIGAEAITGFREPDPSCFVGVAGVLAESPRVSGRSLRVASPLGQPAGGVRFALLVQIVLVTALPFVVVAVLRRRWRELSYALCGEGAVAFVACLSILQNRRASSAPVAHVPDRALGHGQLARVNQVGALKAAVQRHGEAGLDQLSIGDQPQLEGPATRGLRPELGLDQPREASTQTLDLGSTGVVELVPRHVIERIQHQLAMRRPVVAVAGVGASSVTSLLPQPVAAGQRTWARASAAGNASASRDGPCAVGGSEGGAENPAVDA